MQMRRFDTYGAQTRSWCAYGAVAQFTRIATACLAHGDLSFQTPASLALPRCGV